MTTPELVLATVDAVDAYREGLYGQSDAGTTRKVALGTAGVALLWLALWAWDRHQKRRRAAAASAAKTLFEELCAAHGLNDADRKLLRSATVAANVSPAEAVFTTPEILAAERDAGNAAAAKMLTRLFGDWQPSAG